MNELPMARKERTVWDWHLIRAEVATWTSVVVLLVTLGCGYKAYEFLGALSKIIQRQDNSNRELAISLNRLSQVEEEELARLEGREPRVVKVPLRESESPFPFDQDSLQKVP